MAAIPDFLPPVIDDSQVITRPNVPALDEILGLRFSCLNGQGWVSIVDYMGDERTPAHAARTSTKGSDAEQEASLEKDIRTLSRLMRDHHTSPLESCQARFVVHIPIVASRQLLRHRTLSPNEFSGRFSRFKSALYRLTSLSPQSSHNKQMSDYHREVEGTAALLAEVEEHYGEAQHLYDKLLANGVSREQARLHLPVSTMTTISFSVNALNLMKLLKLRTAPDAQKEIQEPMWVLDSILSLWMPNLYALYKNHVRDAVSLSRKELDALVEYLNDMPIGHVGETLADVLGRLRTAARVDHNRHSN